KIYFDDFSLAQPLPWLPHPKGDPEQDELWLLSGDQVFGKLTRATAHGIQLQGAFGPRIVRWGDVRGIYFRSPTSPSTPMPGNSVRIWLRSATGWEPDVLDGTVQALDAHHLILVHEQLGRLEIDRPRVRRVRSLAAERFPGRR